MLRKAFRFVGEEPLMTSWGSDILSEIRAKKWQFTGEELVWILERS